ncbi:T-box transcription factor TBX6 [Taenia crassiceps]|uniref:T-box transcription factor TBX6 n=1 Tax=Taenia crassiceps TaxID=6207 RepID=A0ABR4QQB1_9CEST
MERGGNWPEEHRVIDQEAEALPTTPRLPQIEAFFAHLNDRRIPSPGVSGDSQAFPISRQYTEAPFTSSSYTTTTCQNTAPSLDIASTSQHHPYHRYLPYTASTQQQQWNDAYCMQQCQLPPQQQQISSDNAQQYPFYPSQLQDFQALPSFQSDSHLLPPAASTGFPGSSMPLTYADTSSISSSYTTTLRQDTAPLLDIAPTPLHHLHHRHLPYTASTQHQHICTHDTHSHSNPSTLGCIQDQRAYEQWGVAHYVEQHNLPQQHQQQQPVFHGNSQTSRGHTVTWRPSAAVVQNALQSSASRLASTSRMVVGSEGEQNGSEHEQLRGAGLGGAPAMLEAQQAPPNSSLTANVALRTDLLRIARSVCNAYPTPCSSERQRFSSICVAGVDYATPNSARRPAITLRLCDQARWQAVGNRRMEMVIGRGGKRIYPPLSVNVSGLEAAEMYIFFLDLMPIDQHTYKFSSDGWIRGGTTKAYPPPNETSLIYVPRKVFETGSRWMMSGVDFKRVKITNMANKLKNDDQIFVHSMQIYLPRYHIVRRLTEEEVAMHQQGGRALQNALQVPLEHVGTYVIPEVEFVTVTAYRDRRITEFKIGANPYATGFRNRPNSSKHST